MAEKVRARKLVDDPEMTKANFARARRLRADMPDVVKAMKRGRGRPKAERAKERVSLRLDPDVVAAYRATGEGWQSRINDTLARALRRKSKVA